MYSLILNPPVKVITLPENAEILSETYCQEHDFRCWSHIFCCMISLRKFFVKSLTHCNSLMLQILEVKQNCSLCKLPFKVKSMQKIIYPAEMFRQ